MLGSVSVLAQSGRSMTGCVVLALCGWAAISVANPSGVWESGASASAQTAVAADRIPPTVLSFRNGVNGYRGTVDAEIWALATTTILNSNPQVTSDANNDGGESQVLMRFEQIIGDGPLQIPPGSSVRAARLFVSAFDQGDTVHLHRMLVPFGSAPTWSRMVSGVSADDREASRTKDAFTFGKIAANSSEISFDVTDTVQTWVNGAENHGWVFLNTGGNGWDFYASDYDQLAQRPRLEVEFVPARRLTSQAKPLK
jgi:hypothetical protein